MSSGLQDFLARRKPFTNEYFAAPGSRRTILLCSHAGWTEPIAHALLKLGFNVLVAEPWAAIYDDDVRFASFDKVFQQWVRTIKKFKVQLVIGGNATAILPHPKTKEPLHIAAGVPAVHYWVDDPRLLPAMTTRGISAYDYFRCIRDRRSLNVIWNDDIAEELRRFLAVENAVHIPPGVSPELWQTPGSRLADRPPQVCFIGDAPAPTAESFRQLPADLIQWANRVVDVKIASPDKSLADCLEVVGGPGEKRGSSLRRPYELAAHLKDEFDRWAVLNALLVERVRIPLLRTAADELAGDLLLAGKDWHNLGLNSSPVLAMDVKEHHAKSRASLSFFSRREDGGLPFRPFEIPAVPGLLLHAWSAKLTSLFEPEKECLAFRDGAELREQLDRIRRSPEEYDRVTEAGRRRVLAEHTWEHRLSRVLQSAQERLGIAW